MVLAPNRSDRVVWRFRDTAAIGDFVRTLTSWDFPAFGGPTIATSSLFRATCDGDGGDDECGNFDDAGMSERKRQTYPPLTQESRNERRKVKRDTSFKTDAEKLFILKHFLELIGQFKNHVGS